MMFTPAPFFRGAVLKQTATMVAGTLSGEVGFNWTHNPDPPDYGTCTPNTYDGADIVRIHDAPAISEFFYRDGNLEDSNFIRLHIYKSGFDVTLYKANATWDATFGWRWTGTIGLADAQTYTVEWYA